MKTRPLLLVMFALQSVLLVALAVSLCLAIAEAERASARGQQLYKIGLHDGELFTRGQILRAQLEREIIEENRQSGSDQAAIAKEKL